MANHPLTGARLGQMSDGPLGGLYLAQAVNELSPNTVPAFANAAARDAAYSAWVQAGGAMRDGLTCSTQNDDRYWAYRSGAWQYAGGAPPPILLCPVSAGWTGFSGQAPAAFKDASGLVHLTGIVDNVNAYNGSTASDYQMVVLPAGYRPSTVIPSVPLVISGLMTAIARIETTGVVRIISTADQTIGVASGHLLSSIPPFHPGYAGAALP